MEIMESSLMREKVYHAVVEPGLGVYVMPRKGFKKNMQRYRHILDQLTRGLCIPGPVGK